MQPTYLPWAGYFGLISEADYFVFLDDVQFNRRSWQTRNYILLQGKRHLLTIPIERCGRSTNLKDIKISYGHNWLRSHWDTLTHAYKKAPFAADLLALLEPYYFGTSPHFLLDFTKQIIRALASSLGLPSDITNLNSQDRFENRSQRLARICKEFKCDTYLSPMGARDYLVQDKFQEKYDMQLLFFDFDMCPYSQYGSSKFVSHLSVVDVIANLGLVKTQEYIKKRNSKISREVF